MIKEETINRYLDGELSPEEVSMVEDMLKSNPELAETLNSLKENESLHRELMPEAKTAAFIESEFQEIQKHIQQKEDEKIIRFPTKWILHSFAIAAALIVSFGFIWNKIQINTLANRQTATMAMVETDIEGASSMIFTDEQSGWTFVWIDEPESKSPGEIAG